jgi:hypothetical protein
MNRLVFALLCLFTGLSACRHIHNSSVIESAVLKDFEKTHHLVDSTWKIMITSDDNKIENLIRLSKELQMIDGSNTESLVSSEAEINNLKRKRYNQISMQLSRNIDVYDSATNQAIQKLRNETNKNPNAVKYQIINQLLSEIQIADDSVLFYRKEYDRTVDSFNNFIKTRKKDLKKAGINTDTIKPYPVFRLLFQ